jgi:PhnB protein
MAVNWKPEGYHTVTPYLVGRGTAELIEFLKQSFGAQERERLMRSDGKIMHAEVKIGDSVVMMGESSDDFKAMPTSIHLYLEDVDEAYKRAVQADGKSLREPTDQFYGDRSAGVQDASGNHWWLATHVEDVSPEEMQRRQETMATAQSSAS